jgi:hypothetical protein
MITPTIGRVVWYYPGNCSAPGKKDEQPFTAFVVYVHNDRSINVAGFDHEGKAFRRDEVPLLQDDDKPAGECACWMPYQTGQAAKYEKGGGSFEDLKARVAALEERLCQQNPQPSGAGPSG